MKVKVVYNDGNVQNTSAESVDSTFRIKLNKTPYRDFLFKNNEEVYFDDDVLFKDKPNVIKFRVVLPGEDAAQKSAVVSNVLRGILFAIMAVILPFAFMNFKKVQTPPFKKLKFKYSQEENYVLMLTPYNYRYGYEPALAAGFDQPFGEVTGMEPMPVSGNPYVGNAE